MNTELTPEELKTILEDSGYLFEQRIASRIESLGYHVETNRAFLDEDELKSREVDVTAHKLLWKIEHGKKYSGICYLNCECKNSNNPFVFITRKRGVLEKLYVPDGIFLAHNYYYKKLENERVTNLDSFYYLELEKRHFATREQFHSVQMCKINQNGKKKEAQHTGVIEGFIYPLAKSKMIWEKQAPQNDDLNTYCKFFFNIIVVNSKLYTIDADEYSALPVEQKFVPFIRELQTNSLKGRYLFTFVMSDHLEDFLKDEIESFCNAVYEVYDKDNSLLLDPSLSNIMF